MPDTETLLARVAALEAFVADVVRVQTFTIYGRTISDSRPARTTLGNRAAVVLGMPELPTLRGLDPSLDSRS